MIKPGEIAVFATAEDAFAKFKELIMPDNEEYYERFEDENYFARICAFLRDNKCKLKYKNEVIYDFSLEPSSLKTMGYVKIRSWVMKFEPNDIHSIKVTWKERREFINNLQIAQEDFIVPLSYSKQVQMINSSEKNIDDKLQMIAHLLENEIFIEKKPKNYVDYKISDYVLISNSEILEYRKLLHYWRHKKQSDIDFINGISDELKNLLIKKGIYILDLLKILEYK